MTKQTRIDSLVAAGRFGDAIRELGRALRGSPGSVTVRQRLADVLAQAGRRHEAAVLLVELAEEFAADGFTAKAIATLKKVQRVDRRRPEMAARLAELILVRNREIGVTEDGKGERARARLLRNLSSLQDSPVVGGLTAEELVVLIHGLELESYGPNEAVFSEGDLGDCLYVVAGGSARVLVRVAGGDVEEAETLGYGEVFGESALLAPSARAATVEAAAHLDVLVLTRSTFDSLGSAHPRIAEALRRFVEQRAR